MKQALAIITALASVTFASCQMNVDDSVIEEQRANLAAAYDEAPFGPQSPRDIDSIEGTNPVEFDEAPPFQQMNLCNIHFHESAEHRGGQFTTYRGNGDGKGNQTGYVFDGKLTKAETAPYTNPVGENETGGLVPGDTIEVHYVHTTDDITPGPTLGSCLASDTSSPQLRVEGQVYVLVNDDKAADFTKLTKVRQKKGFFQAARLPKIDLGEPVMYAGSTTGPKFNEEGSPLQVTWSVHPEVLKVSISSVEAWLADNQFDEAGAQGVRNLVLNPELLSPIG